MSYHGSNNPVRLESKRSVSTEKDFAQYSILFVNRSFGTRFLTAITANTATIFECRWLGFITYVPVYGFRVDGTHLNTCAAIVACCLIDCRSRAYSILDERPYTPAGG